MTTAVWIGFAAGVAALVAIDLWISRGHRITPRTALGWSAFWIALALSFGGVVWAWKGGDAGLEYLTGWLIEKSLSVDNLFVFLLVFARFRVPLEWQHRVLTWGILGAMIMRAILILAGAALIERYHVVVFVFGALLAWTGVRTARDWQRPLGHAGGGRLSRALRRWLPLTDRYEDGKFFTRENGRRVGTTLFLVLLVIEGTDVLFAIDSIPAIFAVTRDPFIVFSSNILAVLGLRALYFAIADLLERLRYLRIGLGAILILVGVKMIVSDWVTIHAGWSLAATMAILAVTIVLSLRAESRGRRALEST